MLAIAECNETDIYLSFQELIIDQQTLQDLTQHWFRTFVKFVADIRTVEMAV